MRVSIFNREVTVQRKEVTKNASFNTEVINWVPLSLLPGSPEVAERFAAEVVDLAPSRAEGAIRTDLSLARNPVRVRMRWRPDIDSTMRVLVHGDGADRVLQIIGGPAEYGGRKQAIELLCEEVSS